MAAAFWKHDLDDRLAAAPTGHQVQSQYLYNPSEYYCHPKIIEVSNTLMCELNTYSVDYTSYLWQRRSILGSFHIYLC